ncbi:NAD(P)-dependent dehydrogenase, short-chain alcohol dehydrogenase family [Muriicola jejuensis]|uniref:SDR family oxidoreductase n=1 Tax=Muriicola jejuensis TaxID=504488 RepID=A0A6P0UJU4_9FLAO|nr:SDR family oxidoreductase [Muriicola jejuensis]NER11333.1 SDR family oxidoreductase [Muriicola jejuensis]SMP21383.1 NAD(P)-dependent dehydrogenase, short-chain alcohol dehydrogenase family [Muriicola jejuensis]
MSHFKGRNWAIILGGSRGLGLATARRLSEEGYALCIVHRDRRADLEEIQKGFLEVEKKAPAFCSFNADAVNPEKRKEILAQLKSNFKEGDKVKVLVHSIAKGSLKPMVSNDQEALSAEDIEITFKAMALSLYEWVQNLVSEKIIHEDMRVISFTSEGNTRAMPGYAAVSVAKVALEALTRSIALEFAPLGIRANCIQAGVTETTSFGMIPNSEKIKEMARKRNPSGRITTPEDVANVVSLLCREEAHWINGSIVKADGGESLR